ncbi:hypothetical protein VNO80_24592 [Phaseolus coccineus]|uniref:Uncharacterized protein n=1 Tax=Phaseolus coccineus TaxID=3886 RepID=A0AAN9LSQ3_PHACN
MYIRKMFAWFCNWLLPAIANLSPRFLRPFSISNPFPRFHHRFTSTGRVFPPLLFCKITFSWLPCLRVLSSKIVILNALPDVGVGNLTID